MTNQRTKSAMSILLAGTGINLTLGVLYSWSIIKKALVSDWGWSNIDASTPYTVAIIVFAFALLAAGTLQDKYGPKRIITIGTFFTGTGFILSGCTRNPAVMILTFGVIFGIGLGFGYACITPAVMKWFHPAKKGLITGIVVSGFGLASIYIAPLTTWLIQTQGLSRTFMILGGFFFLISLPLARLIDNPPCGYVAEAPKSVRSMSEAQTSATADFTWQEALRTPQFYPLWLMFAFSSSAGLMIIGNIASIAKTQAAVENGFYLVALLALFNASGRIMAGLLSDRLGRIPSMRIAFALQCINMLLFPTYVSFIGIAVGTALAGLSYGALFALFPSVTADYFGLKNLGTNFGALFTAWGLSGALGPIIAAKAMDSTGSYLLSYQISAGLLALALIMTAGMKAPVRNVENVPQSKLSFRMRRYL